MLNWLQTQYHRLLISLQGPALDALLTEVRRLKTHRDDLLKIAHNMTLEKAEASAKLRELRAETSQKVAIGNGSYVYCSPSDMHDVHALITGDIDKRLVLAKQLDAAKARINELEARLSRKSVARDANGRFLPKGAGK